MSNELQRINVIPAEAVNERFDRIENKIDKLSDAMISLARTEEKLIQMETDRANTLERLNRHSEKIDELNDEVKENTRVSQNITKVTWMVVAALVGVAVKVLFMAP